MPEGLQQGDSGGIETFPATAPLDLHPLWQCQLPDGSWGAALHHPWGARSRPDWAERGLIIWPRGGEWCCLRLRLSLPLAWQIDGEVAVARLALRWWADRAELRVEGELVHTGDLFDTACRWCLPRSWWKGEPLDLELRLRSPLHDEGALIGSRIELEPLDPLDPRGVLQGTVAELARLRTEWNSPGAAADGVIHVLGHAHLDLAWLWPVADTWRAAERTFASALGLMERFPSLHFGHSTPALYEWLERQRPALFARIREQMVRGRWEPLNGPWVECDCVLVSTASLLRQFQEGQHYSRRTFPEWSHHLAWLPDSFGFGAGLPAVAAATGVRWFCTHKLAWNAANPFPHRLFRWRSRCGAEVLALMNGPIGTDGDPLAMERYRLAWQHSSGCSDALWLPGVGDHGGGPTAEMLEQLSLWQRQAEARGVAAQQRHGTLRTYLDGLESLGPRLPVWRDELYLELHRGCATSRPDQKRHGRSLERLLREAELAWSLVIAGASGPLASASERIDWRPLLFQQFHDILPGTSIPEVFEQAEPEWRQARRRARKQRDEALRLLLGWQAPSPGHRPRRWRVAQLLPLPAQSRTLRLPPGPWMLLSSQGPHLLPAQPAPRGGQWAQVPCLEGVAAWTLEQASSAVAAVTPSQPIEHPVRLEVASDLGPGRWRLGNGLVTAAIGPEGVEQLWDRGGTAQLQGPLAWCRWRDHGEFWDAWDLASDYRDHPLPWHWQEEPEWTERGPLCGAFRWRGRCGRSPVRLDGRLLAGSPWLELTLSLSWRQRHELLRLEIPLAQAAQRWAADTSGGLLERPADPVRPREAARWEVAAISWMASVAGGGEEGDGRGGGLAVLLDGPQGVSASAHRLGVSLLRAPTWPDPGADNGWQRQRVALMPCPDGWRQSQVPGHARRLREPLWLRPSGNSEAPILPRSLFPALGEDLQLVGLRTTQSAQPSLVLSVQNQGPCRRRLNTGAEWQVVERLDGLDRPLPPEGDVAEVGPWQLGFWRLLPAAPQSSWSSKGSVSPLEGGPNAV